MLKKELQRIKSGISGFDEDKIGGIGAIVSFIGYIVAVALFVFELVMFFMEGGYTGFFKHITSLRGNAADYWDAPLVTVFLGFVFILVILAFIRYFKSETIVFKLLGGLMLVITIGCTVAYYIMYGLYVFGMYAASDKTRAISKGFTYAAVIAIVLSLVLLMVREKQLALGALIYFVLTYIVMPVVTCMIENPQIIIVGILAIVAYAIVANRISNRPVNPAVASEPAKTGEEAGAAAISGEEVETSADAVTPANATAQAVNAASTANATAELANATAAPAELVAAKAEVPVRHSLTRAQVDAIYDIEKRYKEGFKRICDSDPNYKGTELTDNINRQLAILRTELEKEAELRGVKELVQIYSRGEK